MHEPKPKQSNCTYCGDAAISHRLTFTEACIGSIIEPFMLPLAKLAPAPLERFVDWIPGAIFSSFSLLGLARFSDDPEKTLTHRSRVIWEEALRRGIPMQQGILLGKPFEFYRAKIQGKWHYFQSLPIPPKRSDDSEKWDDKILMKRVLHAAHIPVPRFKEISLFSKIDAVSIFNELGNTLIVKPRAGSRGRHTTTHITTPEMLHAAIKVGHIIAPRLAIEEHLLGDVCRATVIDGKLAGFYRASTPFITGDGVQPIAVLIDEKNKNRSERIEAIVVTDEMKEYITRFGYSLESILPKDKVLPLTHRTGRFYGGTTKEMLDELHPSFIPIIEQAARTLNIIVVGFDCIVPDPTKEESTQRWGIIESNTLPFIDLHYFALEGKPKNIAGMIWDLWDKKIN